MTNYFWTRMFYIFNACLKKELYTKGYSNCSPIILFFSIKFIFTFCISNTRWFDKESPQQCVNVPVHMNNPIQIGNISFPFSLRDPLTLLFLLLEDFDSSKNPPLSITLRPIPERISVAVALCVDKFEIKKPLQVEGGPVIAPSQGSQSLIGKWLAHVSAHAFAQMCRKTFFFSFEKVTQF